MLILIGGIVIIVVFLLIVHYTLNKDDFFDKSLFLSMFSLIGIFIYIMFILNLSKTVMENEDLYTAELIETHIAVEKVDKDSENYLDIVDKNEVKIIIKKYEYKTEKIFNILYDDVFFENTSEEPKIEVYKYVAKDKLINEFIFKYKKKIIIYDKNTDDLKSKIIIP